MWILETDPPRWLAPNKTYTIGRRTQRDHLDFISMDGTSISRNHLSIQTGNYNTEAVDTITTVKLMDMKSKFGTKVNNKELESPQMLASSPIELRLGPSSHLRLVWKPINISFSTGEKEEAQRVMWDHAMKALGPLDIKLSSNITPFTTHFMKGTHLTSKLALALALNLPILNVQFLDAIQSAATDLELDFGKWPQEAQFLGDPLWAPNYNRNTCFSGQKFVVYEESQYRNLAPVMQATGGEIRLVEPNDAVEAEEILIKPQNKLLTSGTNQKLFTDHSDILEAIKRGVSVKPQTNSRRRPQRAGLMDFLTSSSQSMASQSIKEPTLIKSEPEELHTQPGPQPSQRKRPARVTMMDHMVDPKRHKPDKAKNMVGLSISDQSENTDKPVLKRSRVEPDSLFVEDQHVGKPMPLDTVQTLASKVPTQNKFQKSTEEPFIDLDSMVPGLALVECTLNTVSKTLPRPPAGESGSKWEGRKNFKAFRRKGSHKSKVFEQNSAPIPPSPISLSVYNSHNTTGSLSINSDSPEPEISFFETDNLPVHRLEPEGGGEFGFKFS